MKNKKALTTLIVIVILAAFVYVFAHYRKSDNNVSVTTTAQAEGTFSGTLTKVDTSCFSDGVCSATVDGHVVVLLIGGRMIGAEKEVGTLIGVQSIGDLEAYIGKNVSVYGTKTSDGNYTLYGKKDYYLKV